MKKLLLLVLLLSVSLGVFGLFPAESKAQEASIESVLVNGQEQNYLLRNTTYELTIRTSADYFVGDRSIMANIGLDLVVALEGNKNVAGRISEKRWNGRTEIELSVDTDFSPAGGALTLWITFSDDTGRRPELSWKGFFFPKLLIENVSPVSKPQGQTFSYSISGEGMFGTPVVSFGQDIEVLDTTFRAGAVSGEGRVTGSAKIARDAIPGSRIVSLTANLTEGSSDQGTFALSERFTVTALESEDLIISDVIISPLSLAEPGDQRSLTVEGSGFTNQGTTSFSDLVFDFGIPDLEVLSTGSFSDTLVQAILNIPANVFNGSKDLILQRKNADGTTTTADKVERVLTILNGQEPSFGEDEPGDDGELPPEKPEPELGPKFGDVKITEFPSFSIFKIDKKDGNTITKPVTITGDFSDQSQGALSFTIVDMEGNEVAGVSTVLKSFDITEGTENPDSIAFDVVVEPVTEPIEFAILGVAFGDDTVLTTSVAFRDARDKRPPPSLTLPRGEGIFGTGFEFVELIKKIANWVFAITIAVSLIFIVLAAFQFMTGGGEPAQIQQARSKLMYAVIGIAVALFAAGFRVLLESILVT